MVVETLNGMQDGLGGGGFPSFEEGSYMIGATGRQLHPRAFVQFQVSLLTVGVSQREPRVCLKVLNDINGEVRLGKQGVVLHQIHGCPSSHWVCGKLGPITSGVHYVPIGE